MEQGRVVIDRKKVIKSFLYTLLFDTVIALFLTGLKFGGGLPVNFVFAQCIGLTICSFVLAAHYFLGGAKGVIRPVSIALSMIIGSVAGTLLAIAATGTGFSIFVEKDVPFIHVVLMSVLFGSVITYFFFSRERMSRAEILVQEERIKRLINEKKTVETHLKLLQAQIEPHFLFNTLSNILSLLDTDLKKGQDMLMDLIRYLRTSLKKTREDTMTIGQELEMISAYLQIFKVRMEDRLRYSIEIPEEIKDIAFPPMLLQPLVENAINHGLEPKIEGGEISIRGEKEGDILRLEVADTGVGFYEDGTVGIGLSNIRERLAYLYGDRGRLMLHENKPSGLKAVIEVPYVTDQGDHSG